MNKTLETELEEKAKLIRELTIKEIGQLSVGHIGGSVDLAGRRFMQLLRSRDIFHMRS